MIQRIKALLMTLMMSMVFPVFRAPGDGPPVEESPGTPNTPVAESPGKAQDEGHEQRITGLEEQLASRVEELGRAGSRIAELEQQVAEAGRRTGELEGGLKKAVESYRNILVAANPEVLPELLGGDSIEALDGSLAAAREMTARIKAHLEAQARERRVPAGAPQRRTADTSGLSPGEKIREGLGRAR